MSPSLCRQAHRKDRALARLARHCHVAAHHACELARDGEAEASSAEALRRRCIGLHEFLEQFALLFGGQVLAYRKPPACAPAVKREPEEDWAR